MAEIRPRIVEMTATVLRDNRRVVIDLGVSGLANASNVALLMPDMASSPPSAPPRPDPDAPSPYPDVELSLLDDQGRKISDLIIVEHKEERVSLTLHIPAPEPGRGYKARAEMSYQDEVFDVVEIPFVLTG